MGIGLIIFLVILFAVALVGTFMVLKEEEDKIEKHKEAGDTPEEDAKRSEEYEEKWLKTGLRKQGIIYGVAILFSLIMALMFYF